MKNNKHYRPLPNTLTIQQSQLAKKTNRPELGLFATSAIPKNTDLGITHYRIEPDMFLEVACNPIEVEAAIFKSKFIDKQLIRTPLGGFINHNQTPNCILKQDISRTPIEYHLYTLEDIEIGTELVLAYTHYNPE